MTAVAGDFNYVLVYRISTMVTAILFTFSNRATAHIAGAFVFVFHLEIPPLIFKLYRVAAQQIDFKLISKLRQ